MYHKRERKYLSTLCKGRVQELLDEVGWSPRQCDIVRKRYLEFKSMPVICIDANISESQYIRENNRIFEKLHTFLEKHSQF